MSGCNGTTREVVEYRAAQAAGGWKGSKSIHPKESKKARKERLARSKPG